MVKNIMDMIARYVVLSKKSGLDSVNELLTAIPKMLQDLQIQAATALLKNDFIAVNNQLDSYIV